MNEKLELESLDDATSFFELVEEVGHPVVITRENQNAFVVLRASDYEDLLEKIRTANAVSTGAYTETHSAESGTHDTQRTQSESTGAAAVADMPPSERSVMYECAQLPQTPIDSDEYDRSMWQEAIVERMRKAMQAEAPIEKQRLFNTVRGSFGIKRSGRDIQSHNEWLFGRNVEHKESEFNGATFIWLPDQDPETYNVYRPTTEEANRQITEFPYQELVAAIQDALANTHGKGLSRDELIEDTMRLLGYKRKTNRVKEVIGAAIEQANHDGIVQLLPNGTFSLA